MGVIQVTFPYSFIGYHSALLSTVMVDRHTIDKIPLENGGIITISTVHLQSPSNDGNLERYVTFAYKDLPMQYTEKKSSTYYCCVKSLYLRF